MPVRERLAQRRIAPDPRRLWWIGFNFVLGAAGGAMLAWGPLAAGGAVIVLMALLGGICGAAPWAAWHLALVKGRNRPARRWRKGMLLSQLAVFLFAALAALVPLYRLGTFPPRVNKGRPTSNGCGGPWTNTILIST